MITFIPDQKILACMKHKQPVPLTISHTQEPIKKLVPYKKDPTKFKPKIKRDEDGKAEYVQRSWLWCFKCLEIVEFTQDMAQALATLITEQDAKEKAAKAQLVKAEEALKSGGEVVFAHAGDKLTMPNPANAGHNTTVDITNPITKGGKV